MINIMRKYISLVLTLLCFTITLAAQAKTKVKADPKLITTHAMGKIDMGWFEKSLVTSFMHIYEDKALIIKQGEKYKIWGPNNKDDKELWLLDTAKAEFGQYVYPKKEGHHALIIQYNGQPAGAIFYRIGKDAAKTLYIGQMFVLPAFQHQGIGSYVAGKVLPKLHPTSKRFEVLTRHQNDAGLLFYNKLNFNVGDEALVRKHGYNPLFYVGFYKVVLP